MPPVPRPEGVVTRGTTAPNRLRRADRWIAAVYGPLLRRTDRPLVVDLGFGASPVTTAELFTRLRAVQPAVEVVGIEIDPARVAAARPYARDGLSFRLGGFELPVDRPPVLIRAFNVLRQYGETEAWAAWDRLCAGLAPGGVLVEGTCGEIGRLAAWVALAPGRDDDFFPGTHRPGRPGTARGPERHAAPDTPDGGTGRSARVGPRLVAQDDGARPGLAARAAGNSRDLAANGEGGVVGDAGRHPGGPDASRAAGRHGLRTGRDRPGGRDDRDRRNGRDVSSRTRPGVWRAPGRSPIRAVPVTITFAAHLASLSRPSELAERLPKTLIHRNVPGERVHELLTAFDHAWAAAAPRSAFGPRQRWLAAVETLGRSHPVLAAPPCGGRGRWRLGEVTLPWAAVAPRP